eukprot:6618083-Prymnesium_polylepis.1
MSAKAVARGENVALKLRKLRKWPPSGRPKAAKVTDTPKRPFNCESDPPLKNPLSPRVPIAIGTARPETVGTWVPIY